MTQTLRRELKLKFKELFKQEPLFGSLWTNENQSIINPMLDALAERLTDAALSVAGFSKRLPEGADPAWLLAAGVPSEEIAAGNAKLAAEKDVTDFYEQKMGYNSLPWYNDKGLIRLRKFLMTVSKDAIVRFSAFSKKEFSSLNPAKARQNPDLVIECWPQSQPAEAPKSTYYHEVIPDGGYATPEQIEAIRKGHEK